jgi:class 3 adenylate cyclase
MAPAPPPDDFERLRRQRETANERVVSLAVAVSLAGLLLTQLASDMIVSYDDIPDDDQLLVSPQVTLVTATTLLAHMAVLVLLAVRPAYDAWRKHALVVMRVALLGLMCWAQWYNPTPTYGVLVPSLMLTMVIVLSGLTFSRRAVILAGCLSAVTYSTMTLLGPTWPLSIRACVASVQGFALATVVTYCIVDGMLRLHRESVASEHLSRFFAPEVAARIAAEPEVAVRATESRVTVLFADISGFTAMSATMAPQQVVDLLNAYFPPMVEIVFRHGGTLEKFIGDALVAIWGAPFTRDDDADRPVAAAIAMQRGMEALNGRLVAAGHGPIAIHVGLCSCPVAAGYIGTDQYVQYAVIGDTTNVASRICSAAAAGEILIAESTRSLLSRGGVVLEALPPVAVKGKADPLRLHRIDLAASAA